MARIDRLRARLVKIDTKIDEALEGPNVSLDGHSLSRQSLEVLQRQRAIVSWEIQEILTGGPFSAIVITGRNDNLLNVREEQA